MKLVNVWDLPTRIFHWSLVFFFLLSYLSGDEFEELHSYSGYIIVGLLTFRIVWGFIGSKHSRFTDFIYSPQTIIKYSRSLLKGHPKYYYGHNPLGGLMVLALLGSLALTTFSGLQAYAAEGKGPLASIEIQAISTAIADDDERSERHDKHEEEEDEFWEEVHEFFSNATLALVLLHILGVMISSILHKESLVKAMITGKKEPPTK